MEFDPLSEEFFTGAWETYRSLRDEAPNYYNAEQDFWALSRYADVQDAYRDWERFSSAEGMLLDQLQTPGFNGPELMPGFLGVYDPPQHSRLRKLVTQAFTPRAVRAMEDAARRTVRRFISSATERGEFDFVDAFAQRFPAEVLYDVWGVPEEDRERHWQLCNDWMYAGDANEEGAFNAIRIRATQLLVEYFTEMAKSKRAHPTDDMITRLVQSRYLDETGTEQSLTDQEIANYLLELMAGGVETATKLLAGVIVSLHQNRPEWQRILADPSRIGPALEEQGRLEAPVQYLGRKATTSVSLHGITIPAKSNVLLLVGSANRDERAYPEPDSFIVDRSMDPPPLTFGTGPHVCLGLHMARLECRIALEVIRENWPDYEIDTTGLRRARGFHVFGWERVPMSVNRAAAHVG